MAIVLRERLWYLLTLMASNTSARARFREALKAVYVVKADNGWEVLRAGHRPVKFVGGTRVAMMVVWYCFRALINDGLRA